MELYMDPCSKIHELTSLNVTNTFLQCILNCNNFMHFIEQLFLKHVYNGQLAHLDKRSYIIL